MQIIVDLFAYFRKILYLCTRKSWERRRRLADFVVRINN